MGCRFGAFSGKVESGLPQENAHFDGCGYSSRKTGATFEEYAPRGEGPGQPWTARGKASNRWEPDRATAAARANEGCTGLFSHGFRPEARAERSPVGRHGSSWIAKP